MAETEKIEISRETFEQFKAMGQTVMDLKEELRRKDDIIRAFKASFELMVWCVIQFTGTFGLNNAANTTIKPEILSGEQDASGAILKGVTGLLKNAGLSEFNPVLKKKQEEKFSFFRWLVDIFQFHQVQKQYKVTFDPETIKQLPPAVQKELLA